MDENPSFAHTLETTHTKDTDKHLGIRFSDVRLSKPVTGDFINISNEFCNAWLNYKLCMVGTCTLITIVTNSILVHVSECYLLTTEAFNNIRRWAL